MDGTKTPRLLLVATVWWPLSARLAIRFSDHGCSVAAVCPTGHPLRYVSGVKPVFPYRAVRSLAALEAAIGAFAPNLVIPCDDRVVWQLHRLHASCPRLRPLIERSIGPPASYDITASRSRLLEMAAALGIRVPANAVVTSEREVRAWIAATGTGAVLKSDGTWGGEGVQIAHSQPDAVLAFRRLSARPGLGTAIKRHLVNADPLSLSSWYEREKSVVTIQSFVRGQPANAMVSCWRGKVLGLVCVAVLASQGPTGAALVVRLFESAEIAEAARRLVGRLGLSGFCGLDFILEAGTGTPFLIEMNPRCTQLGHLSLPGQGDLAGTLCAELTGRSDDAAPSPIRERVVAFFPRSLSENPLDDAGTPLHRDVPQGYPALVEELLKPPWPDRQWIARLYHRFHAPRTVPTTRFEVPAPPRGKSQSA